MQTFINRASEFVALVASTPIALTIAKVSLLLAVTLIVAHALGRRSASIRHRVLALGMFAALALPILAAFGPAWSLPVLPANDMAFESPVFDALPAPAPPPAPPSPPVAATPAIAPVPAIAAIPAIAPIPAIAAASAVAPLPANSIGGLGDTQSESLAAHAFASFSVTRFVMVALAAVWCIGFAVAFIPWIVGVRFRRALARGATDNISTAWTVSIESLRRADMLSPRVSVMTSHLIDTPMTWGTISPVILVPQHSDWDAQQRRAALLHEVAHVERHDSAVQFVSRLVCAMHWFNPLVWMVARREQLAREQSCDNSVLSSGIAASRYAEQLMQFTQFMSNEVLTNRARAAIMPMATSSSAATRLRAILDATQSRNGLNARTKVAMTVAAIAACSVLAGATPVRAAEIAAERVDVDQPVPATVSEKSTADSLRVTAAGLTSVASAIAPRTTETAPHQTTTRTIETFSDDPRTTGYVDSMRTDVPALQPLDFKKLVGAVAEGGVRAPAAVRTPAQAAAQALCDYSGSGSRSVTWTGKNSDDVDRSITIKYKTRRCEIEFSVRGQLKLTDAGNDIASFSNGGQLRITEEANGQEREARLSPASNGGVTREYSLNGSKKPWDSEASGWFQGAIVSLDRETGFLANERIPILLKQGGPSAVLAEIGRMTGDEGRRAYATRLIKADVLSGSQIEDLVTNVASRISSDYGKADLLIAVSQLQATNARTQSLVATEATRIGSDFEHRRALMALLARKDLTAEAYRNIVESSKTIGSDFETAELMIALVKSASGNPDMTTNASIMVPRMARIGSDFEKRRALQSILTWPLSEAAMTQLLNASMSIGSDFEHAELLLAAANRGPITGTAREAYVKSMQAIGADHERSRVQSRYINLKVF